MKLTLLMDYYLAECSGNLAPGLPRAQTVDGWAST